MSDCGVCVYQDFEPADIFEQEDCVARKPWNCSECRRGIKVGEKYQLTSMLIEGHWQKVRDCLVCAEIRKAFSCDGECCGGGMFWESMRDNFDSLNESCFDKLTTPEAKKYLRERWMEWKGLKN